MNRKTAREIAEKITDQELKEMFDNAKELITNWEVNSIVNKSMSKGAAWNILAANFEIGQDHHILGKTNMIREFGEFLPKHLKPVTRSRKTQKPIWHQEPKFN